MPSFSEIPELRCKLQHSIRWVKDSLCADNRFDPLIHFDKMIDSEFWHGAGITLQHFNMVFVVNATEAIWLCHLLFLQFWFFVTYYLPTVIYDIRLFTILCQENCCSIYFVLLSMHLRHMFSMVIKEYHNSVEHRQGIRLSLIMPLSHRWVHYWIRDTASVMTDLWLPSQLQSITTVRPVPNYTVWCGWSLWVTVWLHV